jgi:hypothetical protein
VRSLSLRTTIGPQASSEDVVDDEDEDDEDEQPVPPPFRTDQLWGAADELES